MSPSVNVYVYMCTSTCLYVLHIVCMCDCVCSMLCRSWRRGCWVGVWPCWPGWDPFSVPGTSQRNKEDNRMEKEPSKPIKSRFCFITSKVKHKVKHLQIYAEEHMPSTPQALYNWTTCAYNLFHITLLMKVNYMSCSLWGLMSYLNT